MRQPIFPIAFLVSSALHFLILAVGPIPDRHPGPERARIRLSLPATEDAPLHADAPSPPPEEGPSPDHAPEGTAPPEITAPPEAAEGLPAMAPGRTGPATPAGEGLTEALHSPQPSSPGPSPPENTLPPGEDGGGTESVPSRDPAAIEALIEKTLARRREKDALERYLMLEVRERIRLSLQRHHPGAQLVRAAAGGYRFLLSFRIDDEGYLFDLSLRAPRSTRLPATNLQFAITSLSPFPSPPEGASTPVEVRLVVEFAR